MLSFDDLAGRYEELLRDPLRHRFADDNDFFIEQKCRIVLERLARLPPPRSGRPKRVLDAGCGQGTAFKFLAGDARIAGCDISQSMLRHAVQHGAVAVQESYSLPFADDTFDAAYAFCVYHHLPVERHVQHLTELRRVVAPGGEVMVFEHNPYNPITARIFKRAPVDRGCAMIRPASLRRVFHEAGFHDVEHGYLLFTPQRVHRVLPFIERSLRSLPFGGQYFVAGKVEAVVSADDFGG